MKIVSAMTSLLLAHLSCVQALRRSGRMTRERFQASIHTLFDDEMDLLRENYNMIEEEEALASSTSGPHRRLGSTSPNAAAPNLRGGVDVTVNLTWQMDDIFDSIISHGWNSVLSRMSGGEEHMDNLFLVCHESTPSLGIDRMQVIRETFGLSSDTFYEHIHSSNDNLCILALLSTVAASDWYISNNSTELMLTPWTDLMKVTPGTLQQFVSGDASGNIATSCSVVFSVVPAAQNVLNDAIGLVKRSLHEAFSLTRTVNSASSDYFSRILNEDLDCSSMLGDLTLTRLNDEWTYKLEVEQSTVSEACLVSLVVSLSLHPSITRVGAIQESVEMHNLVANWVVQGRMTDVKGNDVLLFTEAGLDGNSQLVSISDTGLDINNCYFVSSKSQSDQISIFEKWDMSRRKVVRYDYDSSGGDYEDLLNGHGTHVSATIIGSHINGIGHDKDGMASAARAHFFDICTREKCLSPTKRWFESITSHPSKRPRVLNASWGTNYLTSYDWSCYQYDKLIHDNPDMLLISSAGNNGESLNGPFHTIGAPASCKNTVAVGATFNAEFGHDDAVASFSSRGPTSDGRIKPDLLAPGYRLSSAIAGHHDCSTEEPDFMRAGTSMASPVISGAALLIRQYFEDSFYPCGFRGCGRSMDPSGSLVRAVLMNGAQLQKRIVHASSGRVKTGEPLTPYDYTQGFGAVNLLLSLPLRNGNNFGIYVKNNKALRHGEVHSFELELDLERCDSDLSITLAWTDPPATVGCTSCLVNDLDLVVENTYTSIKHYPNGRSTPDRINNVERIRIENSDIYGKYRVSVTANRLDPKFNHQRYSLVATGCFTSPDSEPHSFPTPVTLQSTEHELKASYRLMYIHRASGVIFSVKARSAGVVVNSFSVKTHLINDSNLYVYKLRDLGRHFSEGDLNDEDVWDMISPPGGFEVNATGSRDLTLLPSDAFQVPIPEGYSQSFYITFANEKAVICGRPRWANKQTRQKNRDDNIKIEGGVGRARFFAGRSIYPCYLDGSVMYSVS